ncbi:MAG: protein kinase [Gemmataceae bacterium]|nr:protein kinase [Gemmataceae bacterium]
MDANQTQNDDRLWDALARWEELYQQGQDTSAEELCRDCPELVDMLKDRIWALKRTAWLTKKADDEGPPPEVAGDQTPKRLGEYELLERIGVGGGGQVFKAVHRRMERTVAVKLLPATSPRCHDEVKAAAQLIHPNVVTAFDAGEQDGLPFLVMEYVEGTDLARHVEQNGPLTVEQAIRCIKQAAEGLNHAHERGIIHRDVKPANLLLAQDGAAKVLDLGLALASQHGQAAGTPSFMAPEQALAPDQADHRADVYALGCTLYFLLTGKPPFPGTTVIQNVVAHREAAPPSLRQVRPEVPAALDAVFLRMVAKQPQDRYQSMKELIVALERVGTRRRWQGLVAIGIITLLLVGLVPFVLSRSGDHASTTAAHNATKDRETAAWALEVGGKITVVPASGGGEVAVNKAADLPAESFRITAIDLTATEVKDADLDRVQALADLAVLRLNRTTISDAGLEKLHDLPQLAMLELVETQITDEGLKHLPPSLTWLTLDGTLVTDAGLPYLEALPHLRELRLNRLRITDDGLARLGTLTGLRLLELYECGVTDAAMKHVGKLKNLTWLMLSGTRLTDAGLAELKDLAGLRNLFLARTEVTEAGIKDFQAARPFCKVGR